MVAVPSELERTGFAATHRRDAWWVAPLVQGVGLATLISYANWAAFQGRNYLAGNYLSPLYSPLIIVDW
ncbi:MAG: succinate dehydrogenase, partial [Deltaproteobacteria bacterium]